MISHAFARKPLPFPAVPSSRALPVLWSADIDRAAREHAHEVRPHEAAGIVENGYYVRLDNVAPNPETEVALSDADRVRVMAADVFFHSHPGGPACPSQEDMQFQLDTGLPCVVYVPETNDLFAWGDMLPTAPLVGRAFRHGIYDCYGAVRDWYVQHKGVLLPEGARGWEWWSKGQDLYSENFARAGFTVLPIAEATQPGDLLMYRFNYKVLMHAAVVHTDPNLLFHHTAGRSEFDPSRVSGFVPRMRWVRLAYSAVRRTNG